MFWEERMAAEAEAAGDHAAARYYRSLKDLVDQAPPFGEETKSRLRILLRHAATADPTAPTPLKHAA